MKRAALAAVVLLLCDDALAQAAPPPLFECEIERALGLFDPGQPERSTIATIAAKGFVIDFASGVFRWRLRLGDGLSDPTRWTVTQRGGASNDWIAARGLHGSDPGDQQILRVRTWGEHGVRFVLLDGLGSALVGTCR